MNRGGASATVLVVDDELGPRESLRLILEPAYEVRTATNGAEALERLEESGADVVTLDLVMPGVQGNELMRTIRADHADAEVIVITGSGSLESARAAIRYGITDYLQKPFDVVQVREAVERAVDRRRHRGRLLRFLDALSGELGLLGDPFRVLGDPHWTTRLGALLREPSQPGAPAPFAGAPLEFLVVLADAIETKDPYMRGHAQRVSFYASLLGDRIGLPREERELVRIAGFLHDVGKIGVPSDLLMRPGALDRDEREIVQQHPEIGERLVEPLDVPGPVSSAIRHHHERWDGGGYPDGLGAVEIPRAARIVQLADAYDAMTSDRPYRKARSRDWAREELQRCAGSQFDSELVREFEALLDGGACAIDGDLVAEIASADAAQRPLFPGGEPR